jgi:hypothetical protein
MRVVAVTALSLAGLAGPDGPDCVGRAGDVKAGKRRAVNIYSTISLVSIAVARRAGDHEGFVALLRH